MRRRHAIGFAIFCLISGSSWLVDNAFSSPLPSLERQGLHYSVVALIVLALLLFRARKAGWRKSSPLSLAAASLLLLGLPALFNESAYSVSARSGVSMFALVPLALVVGAVAFQTTLIGPQQSRSLMMPALIGFGGALLLPSFQLPSSLRQGLLFSVVFAAILLTATGSLWIHKLLRNHALLPAVTILCGANALFLAVVALLTDFVLPSGSVLARELLRSVLLDLPQLLLFVWLLRELDPVRFGSRFLFAPLLSVMEGLFLLRPPVDLRMGAALILMAAGGMVLLLWTPAADSEAPSGLGLR